MAAIAAIGIYSNSLNKSLEPIKSLIFKIDVTNKVQCPVLANTSNQTNQSIIQIGNIKNFTYVHKPSSLLLI